MLLRGAPERSQIPAGDYEVAWSASGSGVLKQVSVRFDGRKNARKSYISYKIDGANVVEFPTCEEVAGAHPVEQASATTLCSTYFDKGNSTFGYSLKIGLKFNNQAEIRVENGDSNNPTNYRCAVLYDQ